MKKAKILTIVVIVALVSIMTLYIIFSKNNGLSFSVVNENDASGITNCKFVVEGSQCDKYTDCVYDNVGDRSCVKGYQIMTQDLPPPEEIPMEVGGGSQ